MAKKMVVLQEFIGYLLKSGEVSQSAMARRSGLSQSAISKYALGSAQQEPQPETYKRLIEAYPAQWAKFLEEHRDAREVLRETYGWAALESIPPEILGVAKDLLELCLVDAELGRDVLASIRDLTRSRLAAKEGLDRIRASTAPAKGPQQDQAIHRTTTQGSVLRPVAHRSARVASRKP